MKLLISFVYYLMWTSLILTVFGLFKPWLALWWADYSNRKQVLQYYGTTFLLLLIMYIIMTGIA